MYNLCKRIVEVLDENEEMIDTLSHYFDISQLGNCSAFTYENLKDENIINLRRDFRNNLYRLPMSMVGIKTDGDINKALNGIKTLSDDDFLIVYLFFCNIGKDKLISTLK